MTAILVVLALLILLQWPLTALAIKAMFSLGWITSAAVAIPVCFSLTGLIFFIVHRFDLFGEEGDEVVVREFDGMVPASSIAGPARCGCTHCLDEDPPQPCEHDVQRAISMGIIKNRGQIIWGE